MYGHLIEQAEKYLRSLNEQDNIADCLRSADFADEQIVVDSHSSDRTREIATQLGFPFLVVLMGRAFWNDLTPFWSKFVDWLSSGTP